MELQFWATTDVGRARDHNEDNFLVDKRLKLFVVCDGMGGHAAGEVASAMVVRVVRDVISDHSELFERLEEDPEHLPTRKAVLNLCEHAIREAGQRVWTAAQEDPSRRGMGTTCSLLLLTDGRGFIGHVGDSRIYLLRQDEVHQITEDHSLINELIRQGKIKKGQDIDLPNKNAVTRAVGVNEFVEVDTFELDVFGDDSFLICSDGLSGYFSDDAQILDLMTIDDVREATEECIDFALKGGGKDNITSIIVRVTESELDDRDIQRTIDVMEATTYFQYLSYKELVQIVNLASRKEYQPGDVLLEEGQKCDAMHLILEGRVSVSRNENHLQEMVTGDHLAETALIDEEPQPVTVIAVDETVTLAISRDRFMELLRQERNLAVKLLWNFVQSFALRMRSVPVELLFQEGAHTAVGEPTPPAGTLVFSQDEKRDRAKYRESRSSLAERSSDPAEVAEAASQDVRVEQEVVEEEPAEVETAPADEDVEDLRETAKLNLKAATRKEQPALGNLPPETGISSEASSSPDVLEEPSAPPKSAPPKPTPPKPVPPTPEGPDRTLGQAITGESAVGANLPRAQVLKRTKLVVGASQEEDSVASEEETREAASLAERLRRKKKSLREAREEDEEDEPSAQRDSTMELDFSDENVEEIT